MLISCFVIILIMYWMRGEKCLSVAEDRRNNRQVSAGRRLVCDVLQSIPNKRTLSSRDSTFLA